MLTVAMARHLLAVAAAIAVAVSLPAPRASAYPWPVCGTTSSFEANSTYQANLNVLAATLPKNASASPTLYATAVVGAVPDQVWAMGLCRGDTNASICLSCLTQAFQDLPNDCSYFKDATVYYDPCSLHYSDVHTLADDDTGPTLGTYSAINNNNVTSDPARFRSLRAALVNATIEHAANKNSTRRFATGEAEFDRKFPKVYSLAQCVPDLTPAQCRKCLAGLVAEFMWSFEDSIGARVLGVNCSYRYETAPFFNGPAMVRLGSRSSGAPPPVVPPAAAGGGETKYRVFAVVLAVALPTLAALNLAVCFCFWRRRRPGPAALAKQPSSKDSAEAEDMETVDSMLIDVSVLRAATGNFDEGNKLGEGGFGAVYKGVLPNGEEIAVKRLSKSSTQGVEELKNELELVAKLRHKNLVKLIGVCLEQQERLLVYEFVPNRSLDQILFISDRENENRKLLNWKQRYSIINGIARGLQYLHEDSQHKVVHRDLKASNVLLDASMNPKISDFGLAKMFDRDQTQAVTRHVVGTSGYMAPEYLARGNYSVKSDAFSFGVMVLEIVTGRKNNVTGYAHHQSSELLTTVWEHWEAGTVTKLADPRMGGDFPEHDVLRCVHIGLLCVQEEKAARPVMSYVVTTLGTNTVTHQAPCKPAFVAKKGDTTVSTDELV